MFFEKTVEDNKHLFNGLNIENEERIMDYPVIYITLKDLKDSNFEKFIDKIYSIISKEFGRHRIMIIPIVESFFPKITRYLVTL